MRFKPWRTPTGNIRPARLNAILEVMGGSSSSYLEIGVAAGDTLFQVKADHAVGVDPRPVFKQEDMPSRVTFFSKTSDEFFNAHAGGSCFDLIYLDGLHEWRQTLADLQNSFQHLKAGGIVVIDDVFPTDYWSASPDPLQVVHARAAGQINHGRWYGDVYKVVMVLAAMPSVLSYLTVGLDRNSHAQTFVWKTRNTDSSPTNWVVDFDRIEKVSYGEVFSSGKVPEFYRAKTESAWLYKRIARLARLGAAL